MKYTREQHEGKFVISSERKSPRSEPKTIIKTSNSNKKELKERATADGEEMNVKIVTMNVKKLDLLTQTGHENKQLKSDI